MPNGQPKAAISYKLGDVCQWSDTRQSSEIISTVGIHKPGPTEADQPPLFSGECSYTQHLCQYYGDFQGPLFFLRVGEGVQLSAVEAGSQTDVK